MLTRFPECISKFPLLTYIYDGKPSLVSHGNPIYIYEYFRSALRSVVELTLPR